MPALDVYRSAVRDLVRPLDRLGLLLEHGAGALCFGFVTAQPRSCFLTNTSWFFPIATPLSRTPSLGPIPLYPQARVVTAPSQDDMLCLQGLRETRPGGTCGWNTPRSHSLSVGGPPMSVL